jgi:hypothetical protein
MYCCTCCKNGCVFECTTAEIFDSYKANLLLDISLQKSLIYSAKSVFERTITEIIHLYTKCVFLNVSAEFIDLCTKCVFVDVSLQKSLIFVQTQRSFDYITKFP